MSILTFTIRTIQGSRFCSMLLLLVLCALPLASVFAQPSGNRHYFHGSNAAPGELAFQALLANPQWQQKVQPVKLVVPERAMVSIWNNGAFEDSTYQNPTVGLTIGPVYRFQVSALDQAQQITIYPTIELINQLNPPTGMESRFPIKVVLTEADLRAASSGRLIVKVVYLENPDTAMPYRQTADDQPFIYISETEDALRTAERLGRPMAVVRLGSRVPNADEMNAAYQFSGIPLTLFPEKMSDELELASSNVSSVSFAEPLPVVPVAKTPIAKQDCASCATSGCDCGAHSSEWQGFSCEPPLWTNDVPLTDCNPALPKRDEFICDGDDRKEPVSIRGDGTVVGLDLEDTVGHFDTIRGKKQITSSNRVCIYSPRFAAVVKISNIFTSTDTARLATYRERTELNQSRGSEFSSTTLQQVRLQGNKNTLQPSSFMDQTRGVLADGVLRPSGFRQGFEAYENLQLMRIGKHRGSESTRLSLGMQSANVWDDALGLQVAEKEIQPVVTRDPLRVQEIRSVDSDKKSQLRLCKVASKIAAEPGEEVEFSIRFDNIGSERIGNVTIIDNLTTRL
ncbi:MAG: hypothetical protein R3C03_06635 [Pirellulaceae bacterium]